MLLNCQNANPKYEAVSLVKTYFAIQTKSIKQIEKKELIKIENK